MKKAILILLSLVLLSGCSGNAGDNSAVPLSVSAAHDGITVVFTVRSNSVSQNSPELNYSLSVENTGSEELEMVFGPVIGSVIIVNSEGEAVDTDSSTNSLAVPITLSPTVPYSEDYAKSLTTSDNETLEKGSYIAKAAVNFYSFDDTENVYSYTLELPFEIV